MISKLTNGDYVSQGNGSLEMTELNDELLQNAAVTLKAVRGKFYPDKNFGSRIAEIKSEPCAEYALQYARQALDDIDGVFALSCEIKEGRMDFLLLINNEKRKVSVELENNL